MSTRDVSPSRSENGFDIGDALFGDGSEVSNAEVGGRKDARQANSAADIGDILGAETEDDDATVIAQSQSALNRKASNLKGKTVKKGGGFQAMGLSANLLKAITRKGYSVPTPIQRKTIPLLMQQKDVVGMARTGSGKTAAFLIPMIERLKTHSQTIGARALVLSPSRELALQTLQVVKELGRGTDLRSILLVGGDSLEEQFSAMSSNPDIVIAAPGRYVHLMVEMNLDLSSMQYVVFDEADRLFEMGFAAQLAEILHALPASRQTLLFSATLPKSLVEFARAGLQDPVLVRLDAESKISPDLQSAFFTVKTSEKEGALLHILQDIIKVPTSSVLAADAKTGTESKTDKKRKRGQDSEALQKPSTSPYSTIIFAATKHRVEYLHMLLVKAGFAVSHVYGNLDQTARKEQVDAFRRGKTNILVVTDVAARGIDIPILGNVINYDFPSQAKIFVHRVGRTARAGQKGWSYSIINDSDAPYLLDLQLFLSRKLVVGRIPLSQVNLAEEVVVGSLEREQMQICAEWVSKTLENDVDLQSIRHSANNGEKRYQQTRNSASTESAKRARKMMADSKWSEAHPLFSGAFSDLSAEREKMLARIGGFRPGESIFEITARRNGAGKKENEEAVAAIKQIRNSLDVKKQKSRANKLSDQVSRGVEADEDTPISLEEQAEPQTPDLDSAADSDDEQEVTIQHPADTQEASDSELEATFSNQSKRAKRLFDPSDPTAAYRTQSYMTYTPASINTAEESAYSIHAQSSAADFTVAARTATMDLNGDDNTATNTGSQIMRWDKRHKKYVRRGNDEDGSKGTRLVRGESGAKIAASFKSGRYDAWRKANKIGRTARVGELERNQDGNRVGTGMLGVKQRYKHKKVIEAKAPDRFRADYETKRKRAREKSDMLREGGGGEDGNGSGPKGRSGWEKGKRDGRGVKSGKIVNSVDDIRKARKLKEKRKEKNARPTRQRGKR